MGLWRVRGGPTLLFFPWACCFRLIMCSTTAQVVLPVDQAIAVVVHPVITLIPVRYSGSCAGAFTGFAPSVQGGDRAAFASGPVREFIVRAPSIGL